MPVNMAHFIKEDSSHESFQHYKVYNNNNLIINNVLIRLIRLNPLYASVPRGSKHVQIKIIHLL